MIGFCILPERAGPLRVSAHSVPGRGRSTKRQALTRYRISGASVRDVGGREPASVPVGALLHPDLDLHHHPFSVPSIQTASSIQPASSIEPRTSLRYVVRIDELSPLLTRSPSASVLHDGLVMHRITSALSYDPELGHRRPSPLPEQAGASKTRSWWMLPIQCTPRTSASHEPLLEQAACHERRSTMSGLSLILSCKFRPLNARYPGRETECGRCREEPRQAVTTRSVIACQKWGRMEAETKRRCRWTRRPRRTCQAPFRSRSVMRLSSVL